MARADEAARVRRCREAFERALRDDSTVKEAGKRLVGERWADADRRLAAKRCGTEAKGTAQPQFWWDAL